MKTVIGIVMMLAVCGIVVGCNKTSRKVYDETPGAKQAAGISKSVYETEIIDVDAMYEMKEPAAAAKPATVAPAAPVAATPAPAAAPVATAAIPGAAPVAAVTPAPAPAVAAAAAPAPLAPAPAAATPAAPAKSADDGAIKQALKDFIASIETKDKKRFFELISYDKENDKALVAASYASLTSFYELDSAMKAKFGDGVFASIKKTVPQAAAAGDKSLESPLPTIEVIDSAVVKIDGNKAGVTVKDYAQTLEMVKNGEQWQLVFAPLMKTGPSADSKQVLAMIKAIGMASKVGMGSMKANKTQAEVSQAFIQNIMMAMMSSGAIKMPKEMPAAKDIEKAKKSLPKEVGAITPDMMKKMQKLAMEGKIDQADIMKAMEIQSGMKAGQTPSADDIKFISSLKKKYKL